MLLPLNKFIIAFFFVSNYPYAIIFLSTMLNLFSSKSFKLLIGEIVIGAG